MDAELSTALERMHSDLNQTTEWLKEVEVERRTAIKRIENLREAIRAFANLMPEQEREKYLLRLIDCEPYVPKPGPAIGRSERMAAVMRFLATHPGDHIRCAVLQRYLVENALAKDSRAAARTLAKKAKQGIVTRLDWGEYRINIDHPELVRVRRKLATA